MVELTSRRIPLEPDYFLPFGSTRRPADQRDGRDGAAPPLFATAWSSDSARPACDTARSPSATWTSRSASSASSKTVYMHLLNILHGLVPRDAIAMAGGCALNSVANGKLFDADAVPRDLHPARAGDEGLALGAALYVSNACFARASAS